MEEYIIKLTTPPETAPKARYQCKKCDKYFGDITKIKTHLNSKKPCDVEIAILKKITEYNVSETNDEYECKFCQYKTKKRAEFTRHINRTLSCYYTTEYIDEKEIRLKNDKEYLVSESTSGKEILELLCKECYQNKTIKRGKDGKCSEHGGEKYEYKQCIEEGCSEKGTQKMDGYCRKHYILLDKEEKINQCPKCKVVFTDNRILKKHMGRDDCLEKIMEQEKYKDTEIIIEGRKRRKCLNCDAIFKDLYELKRHENRNTSCTERRQKAEKMSEYLFINDDGKVNYQCPRCDKIFDDRFNCERHIDGPRDCNPEYEIREINGKTVIFKEKNKYSILENGNLVRLCKHEYCTLSPIDGHHCTQHGGIAKVYKCENIDDVDGECQSNCKVIIDGIRYCIFHGGQPKLKKCENEDCDKLIHSSRFCGTHKLVKSVRNKDNDKIKHKKYYKNNIEKHIVNSSKSSDKKSKRDIEHKDYITEAYIKARIEMSDFVCHWCNRTIHQNIGNYDIDQISFDRLDNSLPHIINNLAVSCLFCNRARNHCSEEEWKEYIDVLRGYRDVDFMDKEFNPNWISEMIGRLKNLDKHKGYEFNLTSDWIKEQFDNNKYSHYTGIEMFPAKSPHYPFQPSIDRIDNSKGHTMDNCVLVCMVENYGRNNMLYDEFIEWLDENFPKEVEKELIQKNIKIKIKVI